MLGKVIGHALHLITYRIAFDRGRAAHHIAFHIATSGKRGELDVVNSLNRCLKISLYDAVMLDALTSCKPHGAITEFIAQIDFRCKLLGGELSSRNAGANHKADFSQTFRPFSGLSGFAVVLLIGAMIFEKLNTRLSKAWHSVSKFLGNIPFEVVAGDLHCFNGAGLSRGCCFRFAHEYSFRFAL